MEQMDGSTPDSRVTIPDKTPEPQKVPNYKITTPNHADNEKSAQMAVDWVKRYNDDFRDQAAWTKYETNCDVADEMYRAAVNRTQIEADESSNTEDTRSKVKSATYFADLAIITAGETAVMLDKDNKLPVVYEPLPDSDEYSMELGQMLAEERNAVLAYTMEKSDMREAIRKAIWAMNKYGNCAIEMQWDYRKEERMVKKPIAHEEIELADGTVVQKPIKFRKSKKVVTVADHPKLIVHDMRNVRFDASIPDMQCQSCIVLRTQKQYSELMAEQIAGNFKNIDKVGVNQLYRDEGDSEELLDRQDNAGEGGDADKPNTLFDVYYGWVRLPIDDESGEWSPREQISHWYEYVIVGSIEHDPICVKLCPNPHTSGRIPFRVIHALEDDKGALHMGYADIVKSNIAQEMTAMDQATDNITLRNQKPWIVEKGSIGIRDFTFTAGGNRIWWKKPGAENPHEVEVQPTTDFTIGYLQFLDDRRRKAIGVNDPLAGEALGGRTSAAEAIAVFEQALKPALEAAKFKANQIFPFIAFWVSEMWKDFGNPDLVINLTGKSPVKQVKPADIYGDMRIKVTAIKQFQDGILRRKEADNFINTFLPILLQNRVMSPADLARFAKEEMSNRDFDNVSNYISVRTNADAQHVAKAENQNIVFYGVFDMPRPEEDHQTHLDEHLPFAGSAALALPKDDPRQANIRNLQLHIQTHQQMMQGQQQQAMAAQPEIGQPLDQPVAPRTEGEEFGDMAGAMENPAGLAVQ